MNHRRHTSNQSESGQSLIIVALLMVGMIGALGLALDGGNAFATRRKSQNAADAAAFAGVRLLATRSVTATEPAIWNSITTLAMANGVGTATDVTAWFIDRYANNLCSITHCNGIPTGATGVRVVTKVQMQPYFIDVLIGKNKIPLQAIAAAQSGPPVAAKDLMPMAVPFPCPYPPNPNDPTCQYTYDQPVVLFGEKQMPGGFQWTSFDCSTNVGNLEGYLGLVKSSGEVVADPAGEFKSTPNMPPPSPWVCGSTGNMEGAKDYLDCWITPTAGGCWPTVPYPGNRLWTVLVFDITNGLSGGNAKYHTVMFAEFEFLGYWLHGQYNYVGKSKGQPLPSALQICKNANQPCIMGAYRRDVTGLEMSPGKCNTMGVDICAVGMSQ